MLDENDIVSAILKDPEAQDALRLITRIAIREVALRSNSAPPVEDTTVIGRMTIDSASADGYHQGRKAPHQAA